MGSYRRIFKTSIHPFFSPGVFYSGAVLLTCRDETLSDGHRANPNRQFHSLLCVFFLLALSHTFSHLPTHTLSLSLAPTHSQTLSLSHSFISIHHDCHVNIKWVPPSSPRFSSKARMMPVTEQHKRLTVTCRICTKTILEGQTCKNVINSSPSSHLPQFAYRRPGFIW